MIESRHLLQESLAAIERLQVRLGIYERAAHAPIAIIGAGCRYAGGVEDLQSLWRLLRDGIDAVGEVPANRWDVDAYYDADPNAIGKMVTKRGGFLTQVDQFDPQFFGISPREAKTMDPQQRLLLETAYEALESAAIAPDSLVGSSTGVFVGITTSDYGQLMRTGGPASADVYSATGSALNAAAGRLSFTFGLQGPCVAVDTACSSSLVAVHLACQSLRTGESDMALAGGVNVVLSPDAMVLFSKWGMMAPDGACKTFDAKADGFVRAEGCAVIALKRLSDAVDAGDPILAVIRGSAVNSDGRSSGLTVPNGLAQQAVVRSALTSAELQPADIDYVEAHGTGTSLGDPIEIEALDVVLREGRTPQQPLLVGSIKTNVGHSEAASGVAGLLKVVASMHHGAIPPHLHFSVPSPRISWANLAISVPTTLTPWPRGERARRAGVSSFGFSGTNAHIVLEEAPVSALANPSEDEADAELRIVTVSARTETALRDSARRLKAALDAPDAPTIADVATTLAIGRTHHSHRAAILCDSRDELRRGLSALEAGDVPKNGARGDVRSGERRRIAFLFTGQGSQYVGMGRALYASEPVFRAVLDRAAQALAPKLAFPLLDVMFGNGDFGQMLAETSYTQPALFALEFGLAELWRSWGIEPAVVVGHSVGEYVAACVAGVFTFEDGLALVAERGRLMQALPAGGAMAAVFCSEARVAGHVAARADRLAVAGMNGPEETVLSGDAKVLDEILALLAAEGIQGRRLEVSHAFHSALLDPMLGALEARSSMIVHQMPRIPLVSNVSGAVFAKDQGPDAAYWARHAREPVNFVACLEALRAARVTTLIEIGPHPTLLALAARGQPDQPWAVASSLRRGRDDRREMLASLAAVHVQGADVRWRSVSAISGRRVALPTYPFQRERYWLDVDADASQAATLGATRSGHPLLGGVVASPVRIFQQELGAASASWLADYQIYGQTLFPPGGFIEVAMAAAQEVFGAGGVSGCTLRNIVIHDALRVPPQGHVVLQVIVTPAQDGEQTIRIFRRIDSPTFRSADDPARWQQHLTCTALRSKAPTPATANPTRQRDGLPAGSAQSVEVDQYYEQLAAQGGEYKPAFRAIERIMCSGHEAWGRIRLPASVDDAERLILHPALLEAAIQLACALLPPSDDLYMPVTLGGYHVLREGVDAARVHVQFDAGLLEAGVFRADVNLVDDAGDPVAQLSGLELRRVTRGAVKRASDGRVHTDWMYEIAWPTTEKPSSGRSERAGRWLVVCDSSGVGDRLAARLVKEGAEVIRVRRTASADGCYTDFADATRWRQLLHRLGTDGVVLQGVVALNVLDASPEPLDGGECVDDRIKPVTETLSLAQAIGDVGPRVWFVTRGSQAVAGSLPEPVQAAAWGLAGVVANEAPALRVVRIDLDPALHPDDDSLLFEMVWTPDDEDRIALRGGRRHVARLVPTPPAGIATGARKVLSNATYLITGGLGGLGLACGRWLASEGARRLVLLGRRSPSAEAQATIAELKSGGVEVLIAQADVADALQLSTALAATASDAMPLRGILHAAGVVDDALLPDLDQKRLNHVMAPKVQGTLNLLRNCQPAALDFLVLFSSGAALFGSPGEGNYAAANSFMDALAHVLRSQGWHAQSINWGSWSGAGMASAVDVLHRRRWAALGIPMIEPEDGVLALRDVLYADRTAQVAVLPIMRKLLPDGANPLLRSLIGSGKMPVRGSGKQSTASAPDQLMSQLANAPKAARGGLLADFLADQVASVLALAESQSVDHHRSLMDLGLDSLMAMELRNRIYTGIGVGISVANLLQGPSIVELSTQLLGEASFDRDDASMPVSLTAEEPAWDGGTL